ncbi:MAG: efflux RND transporter periplasmic adaptor subunit [Bacteroidia bacterium]
MNKAYHLLILLLLLFAGCKDKSEHENDHGSEVRLKQLSYTLYSEKTELFVEFQPLVVNQNTRFAIHLTKLGETFLPLTEGKVTVSLIVDGKGIRNSTDAPTSPGIYRLALKPIKPGKGKLIFEIVTEGYSDRFEIDNIEVYADENEANKYNTENEAEGDITYLKGQAWKEGFANTQVVKQSFYNIIKTSGQILSAPGDEIMITAKSGGIVRFIGNKTISGSEVKSGTNLFTISGGEMTVGNVDVAYSQAKNNYDRTKAEFNRASELIKDQIISEREYLNAKSEYENAETAFNNLSRNYTNKGQNISSPMSGFINNIFVNEGQYVEAGTPLATVSKNKNLILQANLSQRNFDKLPSINSANFIPEGSQTTYNTDLLNGRLVSFGKSVSVNSPFISVTFEIDNIGNLIPGSAAEVFLKTTPISNALVVPVTSLIEEQGSFYVYVQTSGENFQKREVKTGASNGVSVQILSGISEGERIVTKGAYQIKLASTSGELPAHGHEH